VKPRFHIRAVLLVVALLATGSTTACSASNGHHPLPPTPSTATPSATAGPSAINSLTPVYYEAALRAAGFDLVWVQLDPPVPHGSFDWVAAVNLPTCHEVVYFGFNPAPIGGPSPVLHPLNAVGDVLGSPPTRAQEAQYCRTVHQ
jgi:hypothetical protein